ncbi:hypothetical protein NE237_009498 [Protea cynaroides]|uniref:DUF7804 domain-containing protein n=1 Tax=Protea cynaroides TaxID=273540 RepID=A0A9Q0R0C9_9MAGN|nr:hypothetical protein NE237_009498 [Protea cynaroides]
MLQELFLAAVDNPTNTLEWTLAEMINQPGILQKAIEEIDRVVGKERLIQESDFNKLNYGKACARESFRLHPLSAFNLPHVSNCDTTVAGYFIPKGSHVLLSRIGLGRNPEVWDEPLKFKPERHVKDGSNLDLVEPELRFISFSTGKRGCMGAGLGSAMTIMLLASFCKGSAGKFHRRKRDFLNRLLASWKKMASVAMRCVVGSRNGFLSNFNVNGEQQQQQQQRYPQRSCSCRRNPPQAVLKANHEQAQISTTGDAWKLPPIHPIVYENLNFSREEYSGAERGEISSETLDVWMRDSVTEIVKNIKEAPFLVHVFSSKKNGETKVAKLNREKAVAEEWPFIKRRWEEKEERGECSTPDGIMLVEELKDENEEDSEGREEGSSTRSWGIVIQGRGVNCNPVCYILKTCRVGSPSIGFCTHFCLSKAQLYGAHTALQQMKNSWLVHPQLLQQNSYFF